MKSELTFLTIIGLFFTLSSFNVINFKDLSHIEANAHTFTTNEYASFIAFADQFNMELNLVETNLANNYTDLAQEHADRASKLFYRNLISEFEEHGRKNAENLTSIMKSLQNLMQYSPSSTEKLKEVNQIVAYIDTKLREVILWTLEQQQQSENSKLSAGLSEPVKRLDTEEENRNDTKIQPLRFAELVDFTLIDYGTAFNVDFDMTDMSNMKEMSNESSMRKHNMPLNNNYSIYMNTMKIPLPTSVSNNSIDGKPPEIDTAAYQSALQLSAKTHEIFKTELEPLADHESNVFITNLQMGILNLYNSIKNMHSPTDLMMIVHSQIHPNLMKAFGMDMR